MIAAVALLSGLAWAEDPPASGEPAPTTEPAPPADPPPNRDDDIFGAPTSGTPATPAPADAPPTAASGDPFLGEVAIQATSDTDIAARLQARDDTLAIGGQLYQRLDLALPESTDVAATALSAPSLLDLYVDARPNDRVRMYARGRLKTDFTVSSGDTDAFGNELKPTTVLLDQVWTKFDVDKRVFITAGKQRIKWGAGRFWNPTDFLNQQALDPLAVFDERTGVGLLKVHVPLSGLGMNIYGIANFEGARRADEIGGAVRAEWVKGSTEITASAAARKDQPLRLGADLSTGFWLLDLHVEGAVRHGDKTPFWAGTYDIATLRPPTQVDRSAEWIPQVVAGLELSVKYSDEDAMYLGAEAFYNGGGYSDSDLYPWLIANNQYQPFYLGQRYFGAYASLPSPGQWDDASFTASLLGNASDETFVTRLDYSQGVLTYLRTNFYAATYFGKNGAFHQSLDIPAIPAIPALANGLEVKAPMIAVGMGATVVF